MSIREIGNRIWSVDRSVMTRIIAVNTHRIYIFAVVLVCIHLIHIIILLANASDNEATEVWRHGILFAHSAMAVVVASIGFFAYFLERTHRAEGKLAFLLQIAGVFSYLIFGVIICAIDQLITTNITPFLITCFGMAVILLLHPLISGMGYIIALTLFSFMITNYSHSPQITLSNLINGITAVGLAFGASLVLWRNQVMKIRQREEIELQNKSLEEHKNRLENIASRDSLTGMFNRMEFTRLTEIAIESMKRSNKEACLLLLDIDDFKKLNDEYGHPAGDNVLKEVSDLIVQRLRSNDIAARFGGEEFAILLPDTTAQKGALIAERLREVIEDHVFKLEEGTARITVSIGVAALSGIEDEPFLSGYRRADRSLYAAKRNGKNSVETAP